MKKDTNIEPFIEDVVASNYATTESKGLHGEALKQEQMRVSRALCKKFFEAGRDAGKAEYEHAILYVDWVQILMDATRTSPTGWQRYPIKNWRDAGESLYIAFKRAITRKM